MRSAKLNKAARHHMGRTLNRPFGIPGTLATPKPTREPVYLIAATVSAHEVHAMDNRGYSIRLST